MSARDFVDLTGDDDRASDDGDDHGVEDEPVGVDICADIEDLLDLDNDNNTKYGTKNTNTNNSNNNNSKGGDEELFESTFASKAWRPLKLSTLIKKKKKKTTTTEGTTEQKSTIDGGEKKKKKNQLGSSNKRKRDEDPKKQESQTSSTKKHKSKGRKGTEKSKRTKAANGEIDVTFGSPLRPSGDGDQNSGNTSVGESTIYNSNNHSNKKRRRRKKKKKTQLNQGGNEQGQKQEGGVSMPSKGEAGQICSGLKLSKATKKRKKKHKAKGQKKTTTNMQDASFLPSSTAATSRGSSHGKRHNSTTSAEQPPTKVARTQKLQVDAVKVPPPAMMKSGSSKRKPTKTAPPKQSPFKDTKNTSKPTTSEARLPVDLGGTVGVDISVDVEDLREHNEASDGIRAKNLLGEMATSVDVGPWDWLLIGRKETPLCNNTNGLNHHLNIERSGESMLTRQHKDRLETEQEQSTVATSKNETKEAPLSSHSDPPASLPEISGVPNVCSKPKHMNRRVLKAHQPIVVEIPSDSDDDDPQMDAEVSEKVEPSKDGRSLNPKQPPLSPTVPSVAPKDTHTDQASHILRRKESKSGEYPPYMSSTEHRKLYETQRDEPSAQCEPANRSNSDVPVCVNKQAALSASRRQDQPTAPGDKQTAVRPERTEGSSSRLKASKKDPVLQRRPHPSYDERMTKNPFQGRSQSSLETPVKSVKETTEVKRNHLSPCRNFVVIDDSSDDDSDGGDVEFLTTVKATPRSEGHRSSTNVKHDNRFQKAPSAQNNPDGFKTSTGHPFRTTHQQKRTFQDESGYHKDRDFNFEISQKVALEQQERLLRASLERVRSRESHQPPTAYRVNQRVSTNTPPLFSSPVPNVHQTYPDHWKWRCPFARLGLPPNAAVALVKRHYRKLALVYHPDKKRFNDSATRFQAITAAYRKIT